MFSQWGGGGGNVIGGVGCRDDGLGWVSSRKGVGGGGG